jgi:hypothetical protein
VSVEIQMDIFHPVAQKIGKPGAEWFKTEKIETQESIPRMPAFVKIKAEISKL